MTRLSIFMLVVAGLIDPAATRAATVAVTAANFTASFYSARDGDRLVVSGTIAGANLSGKSWATPVVIDARNASFPDSMLFKRIAGLTIIGGNFGSATASTRLGRALIIDSSDRIRLMAPKVTGNRIDSGIQISNTTNASVSGGTFTGLNRGLAFTAVSNGTISNNRFLASSSDGVAIVDSHGVVARNNSCSGTVPAPGAHPDCIQMWTSAGLPLASDIKIIDNSASDATQGFTLFDGGGLRITITGNRVDTSYPQGIACYGCVDSVITTNVLTTQPGSAHVTKINIVGGSNNIVADNSVGPRS